MNNTGKKGGIITELLKYAVTGANLIPTALLGLVLFYWIIVILGAFDFEFLDFDVDLEGAEQLGPFYAILAFLNVAELPVMLVFSIVTLNFWLLAMLIFYLPIIQGGLIHSLLLIPAFIASLIMSKYETIPLKGVFKYGNGGEKKGNQVIKQLSVLISDVKDGRMGQAEIKRDGASIIFNVKAEDNEEAFVKGETVFVNRKDEEKDIYYIVKFEE